MDAVSRSDQQRMEAAERRAIYAAFKNRDTSADGCVYVGVASTGIYCRPVCTVRSPRLENCAFYPHAAAAEKAGFRPCLLCRPELAPGDARVDATSTLARLALRRIEDGALNSMSVDALAAEFDVSARHLRRAMVSELGVTPVEVAQTQRLLHAKQLLTESTLSITDVAHTAGFDSLRRFNALFKTRYRLAPRELRREYRASAGEADADAADATTFRVDYRPPFDWHALLEFLALRAIPSVEVRDNDTYLRTFALDRHCGWLRVGPRRGRRGVRTRHSLDVTISAGLLPVSMLVLARVKALFDTRADMSLINARLARDELLKPLVEACPGRRLPGAADGFELLLRAILGQQVSVRGATTLAGRMAEKFGTAVHGYPAPLARETPTAARLAQARVDSIAAIGLPRKRAETIRHAARAVADGDIVLAPGADPDATCAALTALPGIGAWTAAYVAMRALAWPDAMPAGDLGVKKALGLTRARDIEARTETWRPWRGYGVMYLWQSHAGG